MAVTLPNGKNYFATSTGAPLVGGKVYAYVAGTTTPKDTYTTAAASVANAHPVVLDSRGEAAIYWVGTYDVVLKDSAGVTIWGPERLADSGGNLRTDLADSSSTSLGDALVAVKRTATGAIATTQHAWHEGQVLNVKTDFGATGDGVTNDRAAIQAAFAASKQVLFPSGTYYCGAFSSADSIFSIDGAGGPISIHTEGLPKLVCQTTASVIPAFFNITNAVGVRIGDLSFEDTGGDNTITWKGAGGILLTVTVGNPIKDVVIGSIYGKKLVYPFVVAGTTTTRATGIRIGAIYADECYYGISLQNNGDDCQVDKIHMTAGNRSAIFYGVDGFEANIYSDGPLATNGDVSIQARDTGYDTTGAKIKYVCRNTSNVAALISISMFGESSRRIENVDLYVDIDSSTAGDALSFKAYNSAGSVENTGATNNVFDGIHYHGRLNMTGGGVQAYMYCQPTTKGSMQLGIGPTAAGVNSTIFTYFNHTKGIYPSTTFTPVIKGTGTVGAGTYTTQTGRYQLVGTRCFFELNLVWTAHTGTANMFLDGLPFTSHASACSSPCAFYYTTLVVGAGKELGAVVLFNSSQVTLYTLDQAGGASAALALDTAGSLFISGHYEIA
jgi:hypothetical protein